MAEPILQIENLGKKYRLCRRRPAARGLRHVLNDAVAAPLRRFRPRNAEAGEAEAPEEFWALRDIGLNVEVGEAVGIIGRNGAGKSTLLKIVSRITFPSCGRVILKGRVASLLEVGTGFHPELTGRENIFLNGAILGMTQTEIKAKLAEIIAFAEVEPFLDTPVKRYSSGMHMRLAFAVAAHLEPEILIVDEVLAVGDAAFQQKCLGKMGEVTEQAGRTILFVSHNLSAVQRLCSRCVLLDQGRLVAQGPPADVVRAYLDRSPTQAQPGEAIVRGADCEVRWRILDAAGFNTGSWRYGEPLQLQVTLLPRQTLRRPAVDLAFYDQRRVRLFVLQSDRLGPGPTRMEGRWSATFRVENPGLTVPELSLDIGVREGQGEYLALVQDAGRLFLDETSLPAAAAKDCLFHPRSTQSWERCELSAPLERAP